MPITDLVGGQVSTVNDAREPPRPRHRPLFSGFAEYDDLRSRGLELSAFIETSPSRDERLKPKFVVDFGKLTGRVADKLLGYAHSRCYLPRVPRECQTDTLGRSDLRLHQV
jgi:hypothetical protein